MGRRGPKRKASLKIMPGSGPELPPDGAKQEVLAPPGELSLPEARAEWERVVRELGQRGKLDVIDRPSLVCYCQAYARWVEAERELTDKGRMLVIRNDKGEVKSVQTSPYVGIAVKMLEKVRQFPADLGLNPMSRAQLGVDKNPAGLSGFARKRA